MLPNKIRKALHYFLIGYLTFSVIVALWVPILGGADYIHRLFNQFVFIWFGLIKWEILHTPVTYWVGWLAATFAISIAALIAHFSFANEDEVFANSFMATLFGIAWFNGIFVSISQASYEYVHIPYSSYIIIIAGIYLLLIIKQLPAFNLLNNQKIIVFSALTTLLYFTLTHWVAAILVIKILNKDILSIPIEQLYSLKFCLFVIYATLVMLIVNTASRFYPISKQTD